MQTVAGEFEDIDKPVSEMIADAVARVPMLTNEQLAKSTDKRIFSNRLKSIRDRVNSELNATVQCRASNW
jgi:hypothetical protein